MNEVDVGLAIILTTLLVLLLVAGLTISVFISSRQRSKQLIELEKTKLTFEKELRKVENEVSEQLYQQFASELHDNLGHSLACIRIEIENKKLDNPGFVAAFENIDPYLEEAVKELRLLSKSMNTDYIANIGLTHALELEVERQKQLKKFQVHYHNSYSDKVLDKNQELVLFRISQEIVHNVLKHSHAKNFRLSIQSHPTFAFIAMDDGVGFLFDKIIEGPSASGLKNILRRSKMADFICNVDTAPGQGCRFEITLRTTTSST